MCSSIHRSPESELVDRVETSDNRSLVFHDAILGRWELVGGNWRYTIQIFDVEGVGPTPSDARDEAAKAVWAETDKMLHTPSHKLDDEGLARKGLLLGHVDVVRSKISRSIRKHVAVLGSIERDADGTPWFRASSTTGERFAFDAELAEDLPKDTYHRAAKVRAGVIGQPIGPVTELGPALNDDPDRTWESWKRMTDHEK